MKRNGFTWSLDLREGIDLAIYLMGYGIVRFGIEFFRQPDPHLMFILGPLTMGQVLCVALVLIGLAAFVAGRRAHRRQASS